MNKTKLVRIVKRKLKFLTKYCNVEKHFLKIVCLLTRLIRNVADRDCTRRYNLIKSCFIRPDDSCLLSIFSSFFLFYFARLWCLSATKVGKTQPCNSCDAGTHTETNNHRNVCLAMSSRPSVIFLTLILLFLHFWLDKLVRWLLLRATPVT